MCRQHPNPGRSQGKAIVNVRQLKRYSLRRYGLQVCPLFLCFEATKALLSAKLDSRRKTTLRGCSQIQLLNVYSLPVNAGTIINNIVYLAETYSCTH